MQDTVAQHQDISPHHDAGTSPPDRKEYRVLARLYRPTCFEDLLGQEAAVQTLSQAFARDRLAHAFMFTGIRGVGKTTIARILARALNYEVEGEENKPGITMPVLGKHCAQIMESQHIDVIEMDAASRTGIDDVRAIIEQAHYRPSSARYKVYIIDEVHMLSKAAFNGLLKILEEPPTHVKFIFATTEARKIPVTILSRCQRFDLRRLDMPTMQKLLTRVAQKEKVTLDEEACLLLAKASEGSARDALSLLDQAILYSRHERHDASHHIKEEEVRKLLGVTGFSALIDLCDYLVQGKVKHAIDLVKEHAMTKSDPLTLMNDLLSLVHHLTLYKILQNKVEKTTLSEEDDKRCQEMAEKLSIKKLSRLWQMLLKGHEEISTATMPFMALEMLLIRIAYTADLPLPDTLVAAKAQPTSAESPPHQDTDLHSKKQDTALHSKKQGTALQSEKQDKKQEDVLLREARNLFPNAKE